MLPGTKINSGVQGSGTDGSVWGRDEEEHGACDASSWYSPEAVLGCGLCRYFLLHDQRERPCPVRQQQCQTCAARTPLALCFIWKLLSSLALFQSSSITNVLHAVSRFYEDGSPITP